jgi:hypothetical protein
LYGFKVLVNVTGYRDQLNSSNKTQYYDEYAAFVASVAQLAPDAIEIWNEPNIDREWPAGMISGTEYMQLLSRSYTAIKAANPNVMVISGAPAPTGFFGGQCTTNGCDDLIFIQQMDAANAEQYMDCTGVHYNEGILPPTATSGDPRSEHYTRYYSGMVNTYRSVFDSKPICFTELGYLTPEGLGSLPAGYEWGANTSLQEQADWLAQAAQLSRDGGIVRLMIVWNMDATGYSQDPMAGWSIIRGDNSCRACVTLGRVIEDVPLLNYYTQTDGIRLTWNRVTYATQYHVQVDDESAFASPRSYAAFVGSTQLEVTTSPLANGIYYWRVRAKESDGTYGSWSAVDTFTVNVP